MSNAVMVAESYALDMFAKRGTELEETLPSHVNPERFKRNVINAFKENPKLVQCQGIDVFYEIMSVAALGLFIDKHLGEAYLITGFNRRQGTVEPQVRLGYRGLIKLAKQSGEITSLTVGSVREKDTVAFERGSDTFFKHSYDLFSDRGELKAYYALVKFSNGEIDFETMTIEETHKIRDRSDGWKAFDAGKIKSIPWATDEEEMGKKTVLRRLIKRLPQSPELSDAFAIDDREYSEISGPPEPRRSTIRERLDSRAVDPNKQLEGFTAAQETMGADIQALKEAGDNAHQ